MHVLALDTSTFDGSVALVDDGRVLVERSKRVTTHSETLLPLIVEVLSAADADLENVDAIACGIGPGSFTGMRIGLATAKGLCYAMNKTLVTVSSLEALAQNVRDPGSRLVVPLIDARKHEVFVGFYRRRGAELSAERPERVISPTKLAAELREHDAILVGNGALAYREVLAGSDCYESDPLVHAGAVGLLALGRLRRGASSNLASAEPTYIRPSDAELGRK